VEYIIIGVIVISVLPIVFELVRSRRTKRAG